MTNPDDFYMNTIETLKYLDQKLPNGSHVLMTGLANGSYLYDLMANRTHPIASVTNNVEYADLYKFLSCLQVMTANVKS